MIILKWNDNTKVEFWERFCEDVNWIQLCDGTVMWPVGMWRRIAGFCEAGNFVTGTMIKV
jgi:hypothetical protein